jgi:hypothetical protein
MRRAGLPVGAGRFERVCSSADRYQILLHNAPDHAAMESQERAV